jgi:hypothetical protein
MNNPSTPRHQPPWRSIVVLVLVLVLCACKGEAGSQGDLGHFNAKLGAQGELTVAHLNISWPASRAMPAVSLKIPREFLNDPPLSKDDLGGVRWLYVTFSLPSGLPSQEAAASAGSNQPRKVEAGSSSTRDRVLVIVDRDAGPAEEFLASVRGDAQDATRYWPDGNVGDLERYSRLICDPARRPAGVEMKRAAAASSEAAAPANCTLDRRAQILVSTRDSLRDRNVAIVCESTGCDAHFDAGRRKARLHLSHEQLSSWHERVLPARRLVDSFIVGAELPQSRR